MTRMSLDLSDDLARLAANFDQFAHGGLTMDSETVHGIVTVLRNLRKAARQMENEVSRLRWNEAARRERTQLSALLDEAGRPGSNVTLFPTANQSEVQPPAGAS